MTSIVLWIIAFVCGGMSIIFLIAAGSLAEEKRRPEAMTGATFGALLFLVCMALVRLA